MKSSGGPFLDDNDWAGDSDEDESSPASVGRGDDGDGAVR
jgi:hypothetical protein